VPGTGWTTTEVVSTESTGDSWDPSLAVDSGGTVHIAWWDITDYDGSGTDSDIFYKRFVPGTGWTTTDVVSTESTGISWDPSLAVDSSGTVHIAWYDWTDYDGSGTDSDIFYQAPVGRLLMLFPRKALAAPVILVWLLVLTEQCT
jgi:hypothetical protein